MNIPPIQLSFKNTKLEGEIKLVTSKSISNRLLLIRALSKDKFHIENLSDAKDTQKLLACLGSKEDELEVGEGGTTYRFLTAYLAFQDGTQVLNCSPRMKERPIEPLVEALNQLGANIEYLEKPGYPPLKINVPQKRPSGGKLKIRADISSQFITALLLLAPTFEEGLDLHLEGKVVSPAYIQMTLRLMQQFGIVYQWNDRRIGIKPQQYQAMDIGVEADWSAASYFYSLAAIAPEADIQLNGLSSNSIQGDSVLSGLMGAFSVESHFNKNGVLLCQRTSRRKQLFTFNFIDSPDLAQTLAVCCAAIGTEGWFTGLETLVVKETDRVLALQNELSKVGVSFEEKPFSKNGSKWFVLKGKAQVNLPIFETYKDHRMAMAFAPFALDGSILIKNPSVVEKSYPNFWEDLKILGAEIKQ